MSRRMAVVLTLLLVSLVSSGCFWQSPPADSAPRNPLSLKSYRWTTELRADSSLFDQSHAPEALQATAPFVLQASVTGDRVAPDRQHAWARVSPVAVEPRESIKIGSQHWNRIGDGPWRTGSEAFPAARAYLGRAVDLDASAIFEAEQSPVVIALRDGMPSMPHREEQLPSGPAMRYTLRPDQVALVIEDTDLNPFAVLRSLAAVRIDLWINIKHNVLTGVRVSGDSDTKVEAFLLDVRITEIEPEGISIEPPR